MYPSVVVCIKINTQTVNAEKQNMPLLHISSVPGEGYQLIEDHRSFPCAELAALEFLF